MSELRQHEYLNIGGVVDRSTKPECMRLTTSKKKHDPYAIYDDENAGTHYFLVPATKDPRNFTRAFQELNNMPKSKTNLHAKSLHQQTDTHNNTTTSASGYINDRNFRNISSSTPPRRSRTKSCGSSSSSSSTPARLKIPPPPTATTISSQNTFPDFPTRTEDDYILLKADTKSTVQPPKSNQLLKREHFPEFAKILKKESMVHYSSNTNCETECLKKKKESIDTCACSIKYKYGGNKDDHECIDPCSCQNSTTRSIVGRYFCMGLKAMFFPCISCYVPAAKACCGSNRKWKYKHSQDDTYVCYQSNNNKPV